MRAVVFLIKGSESDMYLYAGVSERALYYFLHMHNRLLVKSPSAYILVFFRSKISYKYIELSMQGNDFGTNTNTY